MQSVTHVVEVCPPSAHAGSGQGADRIFVIGCGCLLPNVELFGHRPGCRSARPIAEYAAQQGPSDRLSK
jgi:hypothetical protein